MKRRLNNMLKKIFNKEAIKSLGEMIRNTRRWLGLFFIVLLLAIYFNRELIGNYATIDFGLWATPEWALLVAILLVISYIVFNWKVIASLLAMACTQGIMIVNNYFNESYILYERFGIKITSNWSVEQKTQWVKETIQALIPDHSINIETILPQILELKDKQQIISTTHEIVKEQYLKQLLEAEPTLVNTIMDFITNHPILTAGAVLAGIGIVVLFLTRGGGDDGSTIAELKERLQQVEASNIELNDRLTALHLRESMHHDTIKELVSEMGTDLEIVVELTKPMRMSNYAEILIEGYFNEWGWHIPDRPIIPVFFREIFLKEI